MHQKETHAAQQVDQGTEQSKARFKWGWPSFANNHNHGEHMHTHRVVTL